LIDGRSHWGGVPGAYEIHALDGRLDAGVAIASVLQRRILQRRRRLGPPEITDGWRNIADVLEDISKAREPG